MPLDFSIIGKRCAPVAFEYTERDVILYALGIGAGVEEELDFVYEKNLKVYPMFAAIPAFEAIHVAMAGLAADPARLVHGEHRIVLHSPIPVKGRLLTIAWVEAIYDKGTGALAVVKAETANEAGEPMFENTFSVFIRGEGGYGGDRGPGGRKHIPPDIEPDFCVEMRTDVDQAALYRLSGDYNPLHIDPHFARRAGFSRPILHGLCTFGYVGRAVMKSICGNDPSKVRSFEARFSDAVFPGDTIITEGWRISPSLCVLQARTQRGGLVLTNAAMELTL